VRIDRCVMSQLCLPAASAAVFSIGSGTELTLLPFRTYVCAYFVHYRSKVFNQSWSLDSSSFGR
jgi:hypothetical protein